MFPAAMRGILKLVYGSLNYKYQALFVVQMYSWICNDDFDALFDARFIDFNI